MRKLLGKLFQNKRYVTLATLAGAVFFGLTKAFAFPEPVDIHVHDTAVDAAVEDEKNKDAFDKCNRGEAETVKDCERAEQYIKDHFSRHPDMPKMLNRVFLLRYGALYETTYENWYLSYMKTFE